VESTRPAASERPTTSAPPATPAPPTSAPPATPAPSGQRDAFSEAAGNPDAMAKRKDPSAPEAKRADAGPARETPARETLRREATSRETPPRATPPRATPAPAAPPATAMGDKTAAPAAERDEQRAKARSQDSKDDAGQRANIDRDRAAVAAAKLQQPAPLSRTAATTAISDAPPDVAAHLRTADVKGAERSLIELATRVGGRQTGRRIDGGRVVLELAVPGEAYADFVRRAAALGAVAIEHQAFERPVLAVAVTISD
jgi:hypothetical protein